MFSHHKTLVLVLAMLLTAILVFFLVGSVLSWSLDWHWDPGPGWFGALRRAVAVTFTGMFATFALVVVAIPLAGSVLQLGKPKPVAGKQQKEDEKETVL